MHEKKAKKKVISKKANQNQELWLAITAELTE